MFGVEHHAYQLRFVLLVSIVDNYDYLLLNNPTINLSNLNSFLGYYIADTLLSCSRIPVSCSKMHRQSA